VYLGRADDHYQKEGYICLIPSLRRTVISMHVVFNEHEFPTITHDSYFRASAPIDPDMRDAILITHMPNVVSSTLPTRARDGDAIPPAEQGGGDVQFVVEDGDGDNTEIRNIFFDGEAEPALNGEATIARQPQAPDAHVREAPADVHDEGPVHRHRYEGYNENIHSIPSTSYITSIDQPSSGPHSFSRGFDPPAPDFHMTLRAAANSVCSPPDTQLVANAVSAISLAEPPPKNHREALRARDAHHWADARKSELQSMKTLGVLTETKHIPSGAIQLSLQWVYDRKPDGRYKARLVARGDMQQPLPPRLLLHHHQQLPFSLFSSDSSFSLSSDAFIYSNLSILAGIARNPFHADYFQVISHYSCQKRKQFIFCNYNSIIVPKNIIKSNILLQTY